MNEYSIVVDFQKGNIYTDLSILVQNDYNAYKLNFEFDKEFERALFKLKYPVENKEWVQDIVDNKLILPVLKDTGDYEYEISIYSEDGRLTGYATEKFHVRSELINTDEIVEPDDRVPVLDNLINETTQLKNETAVLKEEVEDAIEETNNLNIDVSDKVNKEVNITLTKKDNTTKRVTLKDGTSLMFNWDGTRLGIKTDEDEEYVYVDLIGRTGPMGPQGEAFQVKKTYANINLMIADYDNMQINDYVMIDGNIEQEDNAKLFVKQEIEDPTYRWHYLADFSGATGIQGPTGLTPNIQIGTVTSGNTPSVSRTGTNENPILNFVLQQGPQGETGPTGATGETGNGILNIVKLSSIDNIDTYQINMTDGTYYQFTVTNSNVTNQEFDDLKNRYESLINTLPKVTGTGTDITLDNTSEYYMKSILNPTELTQDGTPSPDNPVDVNVITGSNNVKVENKNLFNKNNIVYINNKILNDSGVEISDSTGGYTKMYIQIKANTEYTISGLSNIGGKRIYYFDENKMFISRTPSYSQVSTITFTTPSNAKYIDIQYYINGNDFNNWQIEEGSTATENVEHQEQNYPITLSSKNLLDFNNIIVGKLGTYGTASVEGHNIIFTANNQTVYGVEIDLKDLNLKPNTTYTVSNLYENTGSFGGSNGWRYYDGTSYTVLAQAKTYFNFTTGDGTTNKLYFYLGSPTTYTGTLTLYDIQLLEGTILQADVPNYAPYIANPIEYCKIGDYADQFIRTNGKNLAKPLRYGVYKANTGEYIYSTDYTCSSEPITITSNEYIFSIDGIASGGYAYEFSSSNSYLRRVYIDNTGIYTPTSDASYFQYAFKDAAVSNVPLNSNVQIEEGNTVTDFEPYGINEWYLKKNINKVTFDGSDDEVYEKVYGSIYNNKCLYYLRNIPHNNSDYNLMKSNRFVATAGVSEYYQEGINVSYNAGYLGLVLEADKLTEYTTDALRVFFQNNNTDVYLVTETPTYIHISETDYPILRSQLENLYNNAESYKGQTNITQTNDGLPFNIELSALRDLSTL